MNRYKNYFNYIKKNRKFIYIILILYFASAIIGYLFPSLFKSYIDSVITQVLDATENMNIIQMFIFIFQNNLKTAFIGMIFGIAIGVLPLLLTFFNGYILGYVSKLAISKAGVTSLWRLLPHGIFELLAVFLSFAFGLKLGYVLLTSKRKKKELIKEFSIILEIFVYVVIPLLLIAALIETGLMFLIK
jgi:stage II sporulation protein M